MGAAEHGADFPLAKKLRKSMTHQQLHDFASGPMKGKPERVKKRTNDTGQLGALVMPPPNPDSEMEYHADQLLHHAAKRTKGYKTARRKVMQQAKRTMRSQNFQF